MAQVPHTSIGKRPKCPLCFKLLDANDRFLRFCPQHDDVADPDIVCKEFSFTEKDLQNHLHCKEHPHHGRVQSGVFLLHLGCKALNPFAKTDWAEGDRIFVDHEIFFLASSGLHCNVTHWLIRILRQGSNYYPTRPEMWFPHIMLSAMYERPNGKPVALFVKLCGTQGVGKTVLATMALYGRNYRGVAAHLGYDFEGHFLYQPPAKSDAPAVPFLQALYPLGQLERLRINPGDLVSPSRQARLNLKVVFFTKASATPVNRAGAPSSNGSGGLFSIFKKGLKPPPLPAFIQRLDEAPFTVVFYDTAGEEAERGDADRIQWLDQHADVVAALVDAGDLVRFRKPGWKPPADYQNSVPIADSSLRNVINPEARRCLVVTKVDTIPDSDVKERIGKLLDDPNADEGAERTLLREILSMEPSTRSADRQAEKDLLALLRDYNQIHRVFFLWTDNLGTELLPETKGLLKFMKWCRAEAPREQDPTAGPAARSSR